MRAFGIASLFIILLAVAGGFGLHFFQESASTAYASATGARLDQGEAVNFYAREAH
jgi:hypothetical protein